MPYLGIAVFPIIYTEGEEKKKRKTERSDRMKEEKNKRDNLQYSETRLFQNELLGTLTLVFEHDFFAA